MARLLPPDRGPGIDPALRLAEAALGYVPNGLATMAHRPELLNGFALFNASILGRTAPLTRRRIVALHWRSLVTALGRRRGAASLPTTTRMLIAKAASEASGASYCEAHASLGAAAAGVPLDKIEAGRFFRSSARYNDAERAAMRFAQAAASVPDRVTDAHFEELRGHYTEAQIVDILAVVALYGFLNRWNNALAADLEPQAHRFAEDHLQPTGWRPGRHLSNGHKAVGA